MAGTFRVAGLIDDRVRLRVCACVCVCVFACVRLAVYMVDLDK